MFGIDRQDVERTGTAGGAPATLARGRRATLGACCGTHFLHDGFSDAIYLLLPLWQAEFALSLTHHVPRAEDLVQETFIEIMRSISKFRGEAALGSWIRRIAVSKALMFLRSAWTARSQSLADDWDDVTPGNAVSLGISSHPDEALDLDAALANLPSVSRTVVWLHDVEGFTHKEIGKLMGRTESFSKSQLSRAYQRLRPMLSPMGDSVADENAALRSI